MPDVKVFLLDDQLPRNNFHKFVRRTVAEQMSCEECEVTPGQIDLMIFPCVDTNTMHASRGVGIYSDAVALIEVAGYAYASRMANMPKRLELIVTELKKVLGERRKVSITFLPVQEGCWFAA